MRRSSLLVALLVLPAACGTNVEYVSRSAPTDTADAGAPALAEQVTIDEISVYQSVKATIVKDGVVAKPNAPLIVGRPALVRAHAASTDKRSRKLGAELTVKRAGKDDLVARSLPRLLPAAVDDGDLASTYNFNIEAEDVTADAAISLRVAEAFDAADAVTLPADGKAIALGAKSIAQGPAIDVLAIPHGGEMMPVRYENAAGQLVSVANGHVRRTDARDGSRFVLVEQPRVGAVRARVGASTPVSLRSPLLGR